MASSWLLAAALLFQVSGPQAVAGGEPEEPGGLLAEFRGQLALLRAGDDQALGPLQDLADRLCADFDRCDASEMLAFYAGLPPRARREGVRNEQRYLDLQQRVFDAEEGISAGEWAREREAILAGLRALVLEVQADSDFVPAAQALVLCVKIELERLENNPHLDEAEAAAAIDQDARDAQALFEAAGQVRPRTELLWLLGRLERRRGQPQRAGAAFEACLEQAARLSDDILSERALQGLLALANDAGDVAEQERLLRRLASFRAPDESWETARGWGQLLLNADHPERALEFVEHHAPQASAQLTDQLDWHLLMGGALMRLGVHARAREHFRVLEDDEPSADLARLALARLSVEEGRPEEALSRLEREGFREGLASQDLAAWHSLAGEALLLAGDPSAALEELEEALELTELWERTTYGQTETTARDLMGEWQGLHTVALLAQAHARLGQPLEALAAIEDSQARSLRRADDELRAATGLDGGRTVVTSGEVEAWARHAELGLVTWVVGADFTVVAWAGPQVTDGQSRIRTQTQRIEHGRRRIEDGVRRLREAAVADDREGVRRIAAELRDALFPRVLLDRLRAAREALEPEGGRPRLLALLHGPLERLPLELIELDDEPLDRWLTLLTLPGLPAAEPGAAAAIEPGRWVLAGAPLDVAPWPELPGAAQELRDLSELYLAPEPLVGAAFTLSALRAALRGPDPLHIATHLVTECEHPDRRLAPFSLLLTGGGLLCTHDVAEIGPRSPLVVLAGCATAEGRYVDSQGLAGMARAFLESGTRNVLVTLWPVEDRAAAAFSEAFHRALTSGSPPADAARAAREDLRRAGWGPAAEGAFRMLGRD